MNAPLLTEYLPKYAHVLLKRASPLEYTREKDLEMTGRELPEHPARHAFKTVGKGLLGFGAGTAAGYGLTHLINKSHPIDNKYVLPISAALGGGLGLTYSLWKARELKGLQRAFESHANKRKRGISK